MKQDQDELVQILRFLEKNGFVADPEINVDDEFQKIASEVLQE